ncbi:acyl carrier protein [Dactylosporangium sp. NPDC005555]|uniref:acyl carrier protein n=1 Tax=Dactylosporangium sp. NPDC005555 TaxID=3154889 RepID=UPI00339EC692
MNTTAEAEALVRRALHEVAPDADVDDLAGDADMRDSLGLDSIDFLRLVELLSERSGQRIDEEDYPRLATLAEAVRFLSAGHPSAG